MAISKSSLLSLTDSGVGAGIDSYYEYLMKAYILLGDNVYLERFNTVRTCCLWHPLPVPKAGATSTPVLTSRPTSKSE